MSEDQAPGAPPEYLTIREASDYLRINQKKLYELVHERVVPATRATGKWLFPRRLLDAWLLESAHGGVLADRLLTTGSDDPLLSSALATLAAEVGCEALVAGCPVGTRAGLELLSLRRADVCAVHWGPAAASDRQHRSLIAQYPGHADWALVRMAQRQQGLILSPALARATDLEALVEPRLRWVLRQQGAGSLHFLQLCLLDRQLRVDDLTVVATARSEREAAATVAQGRADCAPGAQAAAGEFGLPFLALGWESFDLVLPQGVYFRHLFQRLLAVLGSEPLRTLAAALGGYDLSPLGRVIAES